MARLLRSYGVHYLGKPTVVRVPSVEQQQQTIRVQLAVQHRVRRQQNIVGDNVRSWPVARYDDFGGSTTQAALTQTWQWLRPPAVVYATIPNRRQQTLLTENVTVSDRLSRLRRPTVKKLQPPQPAGLAPPPLRVSLAEKVQRNRPRPTTAWLVRPPLIADETVVVDQNILTALVDTRPRPTTHKLFPPAVVTPAAVVVYEGPPPVFVRIRPRRTRYVLEPPTTLQVFFGPRSVLTRIRPRPTTDRLRPPTVVRVPAVEQQQQTIRVRLVRGRAGKTMFRLRPPVVVRVPSVEQEQQTIRVNLVRGRAGKTATHVFPPTVLRVPSVEQQLRTLRIALVRGRAGKTEWRLYPPTVVAGVTYPGSRVVLTKIRPRPTEKVLRPPVVVRVPSVEQEQQTIRVAFVQTRPRPTEKTLRPPAVIRVPSVEQEQQTIRSSLVQTRPRPTTTDLQPPAVIIDRPPVDVTAQVALVRIRPRPTTTVLGPPIFYKATSQIRKQLVRTRPRPTVRSLKPPTQLRTFATGKPSLTRTRPRHTIWQLRPPTVVRVPSVEQEQRDKRIALVRTRPRPTHTELRPPRVLAAFRDNKLRVVLAPARRPKTRNVRPTVLYKPPVVTTLRSWVTRTRPRPTVKRIYPPTVVFETVFVNYPMRIWTIAVEARDRFIDRTKSLLKPPGPIRVPGNTCLDDFPAVISCLDDEAAVVSCLDDEAATVSCIDDEAATVVCLDDQSAVIATLEEEN